MKVALVIQARCGSTRLPQKILKPLGGVPLLQRMVERVEQGVSMLRQQFGSSASYETIIATTTDSVDQAITRIAEELNIRCYCGHSTDLLDRHLQAARAAEADVVVKIPSDCPLIDPAVVCRVISTYINVRRSADYVSNLHPASYPDGNDVEVMPIHVLEQAWHEAERPYERQHTTPFIWERPERFRLVNVSWETGLDYSMSHRWTIDYPEDYEFIRMVFKHLWNPDRTFSLEEILALLDAHPSIAQVNAQYAGVNWYRHHLDELKTVDRSRTRIPEES